MSGRFQIPQATLRNQARAADPRVSAWVSANAGSGKTHVLVNRVLRLLVDEVEPGRILCITYTRAAAANMQNRLFGRLAEWATAPEQGLKQQLVALTGEPPSSTRLAKARQLFARALETPGGLRIETIHAFCTRVLQAAPFEANVPPRFAVADEAEQAELLRDARRAVLAEAASAPQGEVAAALDLLAQEAAQQTFDGVMVEALRRRELFTGEDGLARDVDAVGAALAGWLGIDTAVGARDVAARFVADMAAVPGVRDLIETLRAGSATRQNFAGTLTGLLAGTLQGDVVALCRKGFVTEARTLNSNIAGRGKSALDDDAMACAERLLAIVLDATDRLAAIALRDRNRALVLIATRMIAAYARLKTKRGLLDYDDLIAKTRSLLTRVQAAWVLYRLDAGIDHILLDEAQDTSDGQWAILRALAEEFANDAGTTARRGPRTLFVVGDEKQSIYGFQGAAPAAFAQERRRARERFAHAGFEDVTLNTSFRSAPEIMQAVDAVFGLPGHARGLIFDGADRPEVHETARTIAAGCVDLWPVAGDDVGEPPDAWTTPVDALEQRSGTVKLAQRIAMLLKRWHDARRDDRGDAFQPGDVMILLRTRGPLFEAIVKALKDARVPVTGRDRLTLAVHPAVEDLLALGRALLLPQDDLTLAIALKTPLVGLTDDDLMALAPKREGSLRAALAASVEPRHAEALEKLDRWTGEAGRCGPFRFFAALLGPQGGRNLALARLGAESGDALDAFLAAALDHERRHGPSLAGFLAAVAASEGDIKRDLSSSAGEVRVMTVHGAKGLEAKTVILADLGPPPGKGRLAPLLAVATGQGAPVPLWTPGKKDGTPLTEGLKDIAHAALVEEHHRLLYVALTRAEDRLIVCGANPKGEAPEGSWHAMVEAGLAQAAPARIAAPDGEGEILRFARPSEAPAEAVDNPAILAQFPIPAWLGRPARPEREAAPPLRPSSAASAADGAERAADGPFSAEAATAGRLAHLLLQMLPEVLPERRAETAAALAKAKGAALSEERRGQIVGQALRLLARPDLAGLFAEGSLAEVPVAGSVVLSDGTACPVAGRIDRLVVADSEVLIADYKTNAVPPAGADAIPMATLAQLAVYRALLAAIYPGRPVRALVVYTATLVALEPEAAALDAALASLAA